MKAKYTRQLLLNILLPELGQDGYMIYHKEIEQSEDELNELERLAKIGKETEENKFTKIENKSRLNRGTVLAIKKFLKEGNYEQSEIADMFGVHESTVSHIKTGKRWAHLKDMYEV